MFIPLDLDVAPEPDVTGLSKEDGEKKVKEARGSWKKKRERARRLALGQVQKTVGKWAESFGGGEGKYGGGKTKYFRVGRVVKSAAEEEERRGSKVRELCGRARNLRPKTSEHLDLGD